MNTTTLENVAAASGTFTIGGDLPVHRLGYGAMQLTGARRLGPARRTTTRRSGVLRRAVELGVNFIDTADSYGPYVAEELIARGAAPVRRRPGDRHQGRADPAGARTCGPRSAARSTCASRPS